MAVNATCCEPGGDDAHDLVQERSGDFPTWGEVITLTGYMNPFKPSLEQRFLVNSMEFDGIGGVVNVGLFCLDWPPGTAKECQ